MRPSGEIRQALMRAACELSARMESGRGPTLQEIATTACVGGAAALHTVKNMTRAGELRCISGRRKVTYRNRPVAEYRPAQDDDTQTSAPAHALQVAVAAWTR
jgi:hydroxyacyl-ACP dehydratase HTD2-like protein with hotdog domain